MTTALRTTHISKLKAVEKFTNLGSVLNRHGAIGEKASSHMKSAADELHALEYRAKILKQ